jgi:hypothetical protein
MSDDVIESLHIILLLVVPDELFLSKAARHFHGRNSYKKSDAL